MGKRKFNVGDEVVVVKNLGPELGYYADEYYHGNNTEEIPFNSVGKITYLNDNDTCIVQLNDDGGEIYFHPREIKLLKEDNSFESIFPELKKLNKHPLFELAKDSPVFLLDGKVYASGEENDENYFVNSKKKKNHLAPAGESSVFDDLYYEREALILEEIQKKYVAKIIKEKFGGLLDNNLDVPQLIYKNIFPHLRSVEYESKLEKLALNQEIKESEDDEFEDKSVGNRNYEGNKGTKISKAELEKITKDVGKKIEKIMSDIEKEEDEFVEKDRYSKAIDELLFETTGEKKKEYGSLLEKTCQGKNIAISKNYIYELVKLPQKNALKVVIEGKKFYLKKTDKKIKNIEQSYFRNLQKKIKIEALKKYFTKENIKEFLKKEHSELTLVAGKEKYSEQDFGFLKHGKDYYVYIDVPSFAIKSQSDGQYYLFDKARVAYYVGEKGNVLTAKYGQYGYPFQIDNNGHPLLKGATHDFVGLCPGGNRIPVGKSVGESVALGLKRYREILMYGYIDAYLDSFQKSKKNLYTGSIEKLKKEGVVILDKGKNRGMR